jgi:hypothetical protein
MVELRMVVPPWIGRRRSGPRNAIETSDFGLYMAASETVNHMRVDRSSQACFRDRAAARAAGAVKQARIPIIGIVWTTTTQAPADRGLEDDATVTLRSDDDRLAG